MSSLADPTPAYRSFTGPRDGIYLASDVPGCIGVYLETALMPIGIAYPSGLLRSRRGMVQVWRLVVGAEVEGRFVVRDRVFVPLGDAAEVE